MFKYKTIVLSVFFVILGVIGGLLVVRYLNSRQPTAGLKIDTDPPSLVYIDDKELGRTPINQKVKPGEIVLKLVPDSASGSDQKPFETRLLVTDKVYTVVNHIFASQSILSSGYTITLKPEAKNTSAVSLISTQPDTVSVVLDDEPQGFSPIFVPSVSSGDHRLRATAPGYQPVDFTFQTVPGYKSLISLRLAALEIVPQPTISPPSSESDSRIKISDTPTGFLRVRSGPSKTSTEIGQVKPGETYPLLDIKSDWYQIEVTLGASTSGWISSSYAQKL